MKPDNTKVTATQNLQQLAAIARQSAGPVETIKLANCRHSAHRDQPEAVLDAITKFVERLGSAV